MIIIFIILTILLISRGTLLETHTFESKSTSANQTIDSLTDQNVIHLPSIPNPAEKIISGHIEKFFYQISHNMAQPVSRLILQIMVIAFFARIFASLSSRIGQPKVIGEILAGIALGPSLLGASFPSLYQFLFPLESLVNLELLSQIGLIIFMFLIGMEMDLKIIKRKAHEAILIGHGSIVVPFILAMAASYYIYPEFSPPGITFLAFSLFMGIAMSITAFPVLARIIQERGLSRSYMGAIILTSAASNDVTAWLMLAAVIAIIKAGTAVGSFATIAVVICYILTMIFLIQPFLKRMAGIYASRENLHKKAVAIIFLFIFASAYATDIMGIHALFGGFLAGVVMPSGYNFKELLQEKLEDFSLILLLPLFFAFTGLRTQIGLLNSIHLWQVFFFLLFVAVTGKLLGSFLPARFLGFNMKDSLYIGILMNTRGLMELIVLNIGYELGILSAEIFSMMVLMALSTTFMTAPLLSMVDYFSLRSSRESIKAITSSRQMRILIAFGQPGKGSGLLRIAHALRSHEDKDTQYTALHLTPDSDISKREAMLYEKQSFNPLLIVAKQLNIQLETIYKVTENVTREILNLGIKKNINLVLMGAAKSLFSDNILGGKIKSIIDSNLNVGIYIEKKSISFKEVLVITSGDKVKKPVKLKTVSSIDEDQSLIAAANRIHENHYSKITVSTLDDFSRIKNPDRFDLVIISAHNWLANSKGTSCWNPPARSSILILKMNEDCFVNK